MNVLIVDDSRDIVKVFSQVAELFGHSAYIATSAAEAMHAARIMRPEIVFLDIGFTDANGVEVCRCMRTLLPRPSSRIVAVFGYAGGERQCDPALFDGFLLKPIAMRAFESWLK